MSPDGALLIVEADSQRRQRMSSALAPGRSIITCSDASAARTILEKGKPGALLISAQLHDSFNFEGLALLDDIGDIPAVLLCPHSTTLQEEAVRRGARRCVSPDDVDEIRRTFDHLLPPGLVPEQLTDVPSFEALIAGTSLIPCFQPIVSLQQPDGDPFGYESLARYRGPVPFCDCEFLFHYAARLGRVADLELACLRQTLRWGAPLARRGKLFINLHPEIFRRSDDLITALREGCAKHRLPLSNLVLEITEQGRMTDPQGASECAEQLRGSGVQFALDDVGMSYSHLSLIDQIRPSYLKISQHFGTDFETSVSKKKIVRNIIALAGDFGCDVVIEGIEEQATSGAATEAGATFGQGFLYSRPQDAESFAN